MKTKVTYSQVKEALEAGFISPLNNKENKFDIVGFQVAGESKVKKYAIKYGHIFDRTEFQALITESQSHHTAHLKSFSLRIKLRGGHHIPYVGCFDKNMGSHQQMAAIERFHEKAVRDHLTIKARNKQKA